MPAMEEISDENDRTVCKNKGCEIKESVFVCDIDNSCSGFGGALITACTCEYR